MSVKITIIIIINIFTFIIVINIIFVKIENNVWNFQIVKKNVQLKIKLIPIIKFQISKPKLSNYFFFCG